MYPPENINTTSSFFHFPSPFLPYEEEDQLFLLQNLHDLFTSTDNNSSNNDSMSTQTVINSNKTVDSPTISTILDPLKQAAEPKKRSSKKDRHSKIYTAHGPRDRRMRLSLDVARKFFSLQDILGFEKASKTVEWLLNQSRSAIDDLTRSALNSNHSSSIGAANSMSSASECEVLSGTDHEPKTQLGKVKAKGLGAAKDKKRKRIVTRVAFDSTARELRAKARERARERTLRKRKLENLSQIASSSLAQNGSLDVHLVEQIDEPNPRARDESHVDHEQGNSKDHEMICGDSFWSSSTFFNYQHNSTSSSHQFAEFHGYNN